MAVFETGLRLPPRSEDCTIYHVIRHGRLNIEIKAMMVRNSLGCACRLYHRGERKNVSNGRAVIPNLVKGTLHHPFALLLSPISRPLIIRRENSLVTRLARLESPNLDVSIGGIRPRAREPESFVNQCQPKTIYHGLEETCKF